MKTKLLMLIGSVSILLFSFTYEKNNDEISFAEENAIDSCTYVFTTNWDTVQFEVKAGNQGYCGDRNYIGTYTLNKGDSMQLSAGNGLCWRRRARPGDNRSNWTNWTSSVMCMSGRTIKVKIR